VRKATGAPVIGLCHGVFHVAATIARVLGVDVASLRYTAVGINHLTWFTEVRSAGRNVMPALREYGRAKLAELFDGAALPTDGVTAPTANPASWLLLDTFGAFPAVLDRHVCEFFPHLYSREGAYFGKTLGTDCFSLERTIEDGDRAFAEMRAIASGRVEIPDEYFDRSSGEHEQVVEIIDSIRANRGTIYSANLPNKGQVPNLPADAVVESPVIADGSGLRAIQQPPLTPGVAGTLQRPFAAIEAIVGAALSGSREEFVQALLIDGSVQGHREAGRLADELLAVHAEHLPQFA
jgi:alpha-galactosidase